MILCSPRWYPTRVWMIWLMGWLWYKTTTGKWLIYTNQPCALFSIFHKSLWALKDCVYVQMSTALLYITNSCTFVIDCFMYTTFCGDPKYIEPDLHSTWNFDLMGFHWLDVIIEILLLNVGPPSMILSLSRLPYS